MVKRKASVSGEWGKQACGGFLSFGGGERGVIEGEGWWGGEKWVTPSNTLTETQRYGNLTAAEDQWKRETGTEWQWAEGVWERASASVTDYKRVRVLQRKIVCKLLNRFSL